MSFTVYSTEANSVDNFVLGVFLMFGLPGIAVFLYLIVRASRRLDKSDMLLLSTLLLYGSTLQGFATASYCTILGMLLMGNQVYRNPAPGHRARRPANRIISPWRATAHRPV
jgi:hypothetical protein